MSKIFEEALADAKKLKEVAEENAKQAILESITPKIRNFIDQQIHEQISKNDDYYFPEDTRETNDISNLMEMLGVKGNTNKALKNMSEANISKLKNIAKKANLNDSLPKAKINKEYKDLIREISMNKERYYEVDLQALREAVEKTADDAHVKNERKAELEEMYSDSEVSEDYAFESLSEEQEPGKKEGAGHGSYVYEDMSDEEPSSEGAGHEDEGSDHDMDKLINEIKLALDLGDDIEEEMLPEELRGMILPDEDSEGELDSEMEEIEDSEEDSLPPLEDESEEASAEDDEGSGEDLPPLEEMFDIDPRMLREELANIRRGLNEGNVDHHFGGKGSGKSNHSNAYGGAGPKKHGYQKSFGGGSYGKDVFESPPASLQKLNETIKKLRRTNRSQTEKLNKYRSAVQTLREQLEDLNLFNAKLLYVNKLLQNKSLNESQKKSVIRALDEAKSLGETKALYKSLTESLASSKATLNESTVFGSSSRTTTSASGKRQTIGESARWAKLAGIK